MKKKKKKKKNIKLLGIIMEIYDFFRYLGITLFI